MSGRNGPLSIPTAAAGGRMLEGTVLEGCLWGDVAPSAPASADPGGPCLSSEMLRRAFWRGPWQKELVSSGHAEPQPLGRGCWMQGCSLVLSWRVLGGPRLVHFTWTTSSFLKRFEMCTRKIKTGEIYW